ncbi:hypothetical protein AOLI_G00292980 [Acnodon oligacanthus]
MTRLWLLCETNTFSVSPRVYLEAPPCFVPTSSLSAHQPLKVTGRVSAHSDSSGAGRGYLRMLRRTARRTGPVMSASAVSAVKPRLPREARSSARVLGGSV